MFLVKCVALSNATINYIRNNNNTCVVEVGAIRVEKKKKKKNLNMLVNMTNASCFFILESLGRKLDHRVYVCLVALFQKRNSRKKKKKKKRAHNLNCNMFCHTSEWAKYVRLPVGFLVCVTFRYYSNMSKGPPPPAI